MHLEAVIERVLRCTCRTPCSSEIGVALGGDRFGGGRLEARQVVRDFSSV